MNLFNQNYHIQIHMHKMQLEKKKAKQKHVRKYILTFNKIIF